MNIRKLSEISTKKSITAIGTTLNCVIAEQGNSFGRLIKAKLFELPYEFDCGHWVLVDDNGELFAPERAAEIECKLCENIIVLS
jgi:hypothetical protein